MNEAALRNMMSAQEKYYQAMCKAKDEYINDMRQIVEVFLRGDAAKPAE